MSVRIFNLRGVPDDEAADIRELLTEHAIDYYETPEGNWGVSAPSLWLKDEQQLTTAKALIDTYQLERQASARADREVLRREGKHQTVFDEFKSHPIRMIAYLLAALVILYFSTKPFIGLGQ